MQQWCCSSSAPVINNTSSTFLKKATFPLSAPSSWQTLVCAPEITVYTTQSYYLYVFNKNICIWIYTRNWCPSNSVGHMLFSLRVLTKDTGAGPVLGNSNCDLIHIWWKTYVDIFVLCVCTNIHFRCNIIIIRTRNDWRKIRAFLCLCAEGHT